MRCREIDTDGLSEMGSVMGALQRRPRLGNGASCSRDQARRVEIRGDETVRRVESKRAKKEAVYAPHR